MAKLRGAVVDLVLMDISLAGTLDVDLTSEPIGEDPDGQPVMLADIWPSMDEVRDVIAASITPDLYEREYGAIWDGDELWRADVRVPDHDHVGAVGRIEAAVVEERLPRVDEGRARAARAFLEDLVEGRHVRRKAVVLHDRKTDPHEGDLAVAKRLRDRFDAVAVDLQPARGARAGTSTR